LPIQAAISLRSASVLIALINAGAAINQKDSLGKTPLIWAVEPNNEEMALVLLNSSALPDETDSEHRTALMIAVEAKSYGLIDLLITKKANVNLRSGVRTSTPLEYAMEHHHTLLLKKLLEAGANVNFKIF
jgi:ankyrin repeat protein